MDGKRFDRLTVRISATSSRRRFLSRLTAATLALGIARRLHHPTTAKNKKKRLKRNVFGCVNVGGKCRGNSANCCSGICQGKKPKKGKKDKSRCAAHDTGGCQPGQDSCQGPNIPCQAGGTAGSCFQTTGNAGFCTAVAGVCSDCTKDTDCEPVVGAGAACIVCGGECPQTGGRGCFPPNA